MSGKELGPVKPLTRHSDQVIRLTEILLMADSYSYRLGGVGGVVNVKDEDMGIS